MPRKKSDSPAPTCYLCRGKTDEEHFCFGCKVYVCETCDVTFCIGKHTPNRHLIAVKGGEYHGS